MPRSNRIDIFTAEVHGSTQRFRFTAHSGKSTRVPLDIYSDADLIAELERRTKVALARPQHEPPKPRYGPYDDWRTKAREATDKLALAIAAAGLHP